MRSKIFRYISVDLTEERAMRRAGFITLSICGMLVVIASVSRFAYHSLEDGPYAALLICISLLAILGTTLLFHRRMLGVCAQVTNAEPVWHVLLVVLVDIILFVILVLFDCMTCAVVQMFFVIPSIAVAVTWVVCKRRKQAKRLQQTTALTSDFVQVAQAEETHEPTYEEEEAEIHRVALES